MRNKSHTPVDQPRLVMLLRERGPLTCTQIGETLWADEKTMKMRQSYARPAGKLVAAAIRAGLVTRAGQLILGYKQDVCQAPRYCLVDQPPYSRSESRHNSFIEPPC